MNGTVLLRFLLEIGQPARPTLPAKHEEHDMAQTAQQKAQEALEVAERKVKKLEAKRDKAKADLDAAIADLETETATRDYIAQHPALKSVDEHRAAAAEATAITNV